MRSSLAMLEVSDLVWAFLNVNTYCMRDGKALARQGGYNGSSEPLLLVDAIGNKEPVHEISNNVTF